jgi:hypothetical protein
MVTFMKNGGFMDTSGNRIYMSGSLNESRQALVHNAENINLHTDWWSVNDRQRIDEAETSFEQLWNNRHPQIKVLTMPETVSRRLVHIAEKVDHPVEETRAGFRICDPDLCIVSTVL